MSQPAQVLIVDDSRIFRAAIEEALRDQEDIVVTGSVFSGEKALEFIRHTPPDVITLDVEMPGMNGLETLEAIRQRRRGVPSACDIGVLMVSAFTKRGAEVTVQALQSGAFDFVTKPSESSGEESIAQLRSDLVPKIRAFLARRRRWTWPREQVTTVATPPVVGPARPSTPRKTPSIGVVLIAASTGGPQALAQLLPDLAARIDSPIVVVQHMPAGFTRSLAESLHQKCPCPVYEAEEGQRIEPRSIYIAPGGKHLVLRHDPAGRIIAGLNEQPPESGCRPSASVLFRSAASLLGKGSVAVVLTGMGNDGTAGLGPIKRAGGYVIAQDEESSVVWGMPGSAVAAGWTDAVLPLTSIASAIEGVASRRRPD